MQSIGCLASWELVAGSEALCSHAHAHDDNDDTYVEEQELGRQTSSEADASWKTFLKIKVA